MEEKIRIFNELHPTLVELLEKYNIGALNLFFVRNLSYGVAQTFYNSTMKDLSFEKKIEAFLNYFSLSEILEEDLETIRNIERLFEIIFE